MTRLRPQSGRAPLPDTESRWRLFVAAPLPEHAAQAAWAALADVRARHAQVRWLPPEKLHLTLVFLGSIDPGELARIAGAVERVAAGTPTFEVATGDGGGHAGGRRGGVAWLRLSRGGQKVAQLSLELDEVLGSHTYDGAHAPRPHLTVARHVTDAALDDLREAAASIRLEWQVDRVVLFRSHLERGGSRYEGLDSATLQNPSPASARSEPAARS